MRGSLAAGESEDFGNLPNGEKKDQSISSGMVVDPDRIKQGKTGTGGNQFPNRTTGRKKKSRPQPNKEKLNGQGKGGGKKNLVNGTKTGGR